MDDLDLDLDDRELDLDDLDLDLDDDDLDLDDLDLHDLGPDLYSQAPSHQAGCQPASPACQPAACQLPTASQPAIHSQQTVLGWLFCLQAGSLVVNRRMAGWLTVSGWLARARVAGWT